MSTGVGFLVTEALFQVHAPGLGVTRGFVQGSFFWLQICWRGGRWRRCEPPFLAPGHGGRPRAEPALPADARCECTASTVRIPLSTCLTTRRIRLHGVRVSRCHLPLETGGGEDNRRRCAAGCADHQQVITAARCGGCERAGGQGGQVTGSCASLHPPVQAGRQGHGRSCFEVARRRDPAAGCARNTTAIPSLGHAVEEHRNAPRN